MLDDLNYNGEMFYINDFKENDLIQNLEYIKPFKISENVFEQAKMHVKIFEREML
jgi:hypothetical protein